MLDNWTYVAAAYAVGVLALGGYWRFLVRRERALETLRRPSAGRRMPR